MNAVDRGRELQRLREQLTELTQKDVADHFGLTSSAVSAWETGETSPAWHRVRRLDALLGANGAVMRLYDPESVLTPPSAESDPDDVAPLSERIAAVEAELAAIHARVEQLRVEAERQPEADPPAPSRNRRAPKRSVPRG